MPVVVRPAMPSVGYPIYKRLRSSLLWVFLLVVWQWFFSSCLLFFNCMKFVKFVGFGVVFGIVMANSEAISCFRIQVMFRFQSFHVFGVIGTAVTLGVIGVALI